MTAEAAAAAQKNADDAWAEHEQALVDARTDLRAQFEKRKAATGMNMGPQFDAAVDVAITTLVGYPDEIMEAARARTRALAHQQERDDIGAAIPVAPPVPTPKLEQGDPTAIRAWLQYASGEEVIDALNEIDNGDARIMWADTMLTWARQDGNTAEVINILRAADPKTEVEVPKPDEVPVPGTFKKPKQ